ncbi:hypothetical protein BD779DRAFT_1113826 [Infundibulicybe gibba]|nr:hypothetical protein BD779DRAFT_1113826 [Infundibulicybe gibba]
MIQALTVEYPITRPFPGRWFAPLVYTTAAISVAVLAVLNATLTGYETITVFQGDFNITQSYWYSRWLPSYLNAKPGTLCDPRVYNAGDKFTTNYTSFRYEIETVDTATAGTGTTYNGATLEDCDITRLHLNGDIRTWTTDITAVVTCKAKNGFEITARTDFTMSRLPGRRASALSIMETGFITEDMAEVQGNPRFVATGTMLQLAAEDGGQWMWALVKATNNTSPNLISTEVEFEWCPASMGLDAPCSTQKPVFRTVIATMVYPNSTFDFWHPKNTGGPGIITDAMFASYSNIVQTVHAAVRVDLGNPSPNNFLLNSNATDNTLYALFPASSGVNVTRSLLYMARKSPNVIGLDKFLPMNVTGPASLQVVYLCRFQRRKSMSQAAVAIIVATLSMFSGGWAIFMLVATTLTKMKDGHANLCESHATKANPSSYELIGVQKYPPRTPPHGGES